MPRYYCSDSNESLQELKEFFKTHLTKEDRYFCVLESKSKNTIRIDVSSINPSEKSVWQPGIVRQACDDVLARMNIGFLNKINVKESDLSSA
ncbi:uncharacterized protein LOC117168354 [Belonocnema kinseyi]|uniref:uncharacterized protein LOC117168354 n=1 Tax=Belonocnema kinseyi TaxID=2817044 RepID=UPI00143D558D|nr:uncharacterized protein LOC117168354 [Belonocnema kinseyi]